MGRPRVGVILIADEFANAFGTDFVNTLQGDARNIERSLRQLAEVVSSDLVFGEVQAAKAARVTRTEQVDLLIICYMMWGSDKPLLAALGGTDPSLPLLLWVYNPRKELPEKMTVLEMTRATSVIGALMNVSVLKRLRRDFFLAIGKDDDPGTIGHIQDCLEAARVAGELKRISIGILPSGLEENSAMWVDESLLLSKIGPRVRRVSVAQLHEVAKGLDNKEVDSYVQYLKSNFRVVGVSEESLQAAARASLGVARVVRQYRLDAIALNDLDAELHRTLKVRPCLYVDSIFNDGVIVGAEGDVCGTLSALILQRLTGNPAMFSEIFNLDTANNAVLMGHIGMVNVNLAGDPSNVKITPDPEFRSLDKLEGACHSFAYRAGPVTLFSMVGENGSFRMIISRGKALPVDEKLEGFPHLLVKLDTPLTHFVEVALRSGANQHWAVAYGDVISKLERLADIMRLERTLIV